MKSRHKCAYCGSVRYSSRMKNINGYNFCNVGYGLGYTRPKFCWGSIEVTLFFNIKKDISKLTSMRKHI